MAWLIILLGYIIGSFPTAYIIGHTLRGTDIRELGDGNSGAANVYRQISRQAGLTVFLLDVAKGALVIGVARAAGLADVFQYLTGAAAVAGHNWPVFLGFRGGRGESTTIGILLVLATPAILTTAVPAVLALLAWRNVIIASSVLFIPLPFLSCWLGLPGSMVVYMLLQFGVVAVTHFLRTRPGERMV